MNWGYKIAFLYGGFVVIVLASVLFAMTQRVDLVTENYYDKELKFQDQIDRNSRTRALKEKTEIQIIENSIKLKFPNLPDKNNPKDFILLYRPSDPSKDIKLPVYADSLCFQHIPTDKLAKGFWKIKLNWTSGGAEYSDEGIINIP
jgi:hypothetical protein